MPTRSFESESKGQEMRNRGFHRHKRNIFEIEVKTKVIRKKRYVQITISDNGVGITKNESKKIFRPYYTTKKKGTGLGLAICKQIAIAHRGELFLKNPFSHSKKPYHRDPVCFEASFFQKPSLLDKLKRIFLLIMILLPNQKLLP